MVHTTNMQAFAHMESLFEPNERGVVHASTRHQPRHSRGGQLRHHSAARQVQTEGARGAGPDLTRKITTPWQHQRLVRDLSQARAAAV